jgi:hypothetical protein
MYNRLNLCRERHLKGGGSRCRHAECLAIDEDRVATDTLHEYCFV